MNAATIPPNAAVLLAQIFAENCGGTRTYSNLPLRVSVEKDTVNA